MKILHFNGLVSSIAILSTMCAIGCNEPESSDENGSASASATGAGGGRACFYGEEGGGPDVPSCPERSTSEFIGTVDGAPYDTKDSGGFPIIPPLFHQPYRLTWPLAENGGLSLTWNDPYVCCQWTRVSGEILLPGEDKTRAIYPDSQLLLSCIGAQYLFRLIIDGGSLKGCTRL